jgi:NTE family protein
VIVDGIVHVDGGVLNNMPTDLIRERGAGFVLAIDVGGDSMPEAGAVELLDLINPSDLNLFGLLARVGSIGDGARAKTRRRECDVLIVPRMADIGLLNFKAYERAMEAGYRATIERIAEISPKVPPATLPDPDFAQI